MAEGQELRLVKEERMNKGGNTKKKMEKKKEGKKKIIKGKMKGETKVRKKKAKNRLKWSSNSLGMVLFRVN